MRITTRIFQSFCLATISLSLLGQVQPEPSPAPTNAPAGDAIVLPDPIPDPLERLNRGLWAVNEGAMKGVLKPSAKVYRIIVPPPFRIGFSNIGKNLTYPRRVVNNLLQERWSGARDESLRFLCNSVLGMGGFLNVAQEFGIPSSEADFAQTFAKWGWNQNFYLMLPLAGPSSDREAVGAIADNLSNPLTYFSPYSYIPTGITYNNITDTVDAYVRRSNSEMDPYSLLRYASAVQKKIRPVDWTVHGPQDGPSLETLQTVLFGFRDPQFPKEGQTQRVKITATGRELPYTVWLQDNRAPVVYLIPGLGSHRLNNGALGLAELLYERGFSVVTISSSFNFEFIANGLTAELPGYALSDVKDLHAALAQIDHQLRAKHPGKLGKRALMGYSMGAFHSLLIAANAESMSPPMHFDRYLAIDTPVRLLYGISQLDAFYNAALEWPAAERTDRIDQLLVKVAELTHSNLTPESSIPLSGTESKFLIGLAFRLNLRDTIFFTQLLHNQGVLKEPINKWRREPVYHEIMNYSFADYLQRFIQPYYEKRGVDLNDPATLAPAVDLRHYTEFLQSHAEIRLVNNANDILVTPEDVEWLKQTFGERITLFPHGGHLGNLGETAVQMAILNSLDGLDGPPARRDIISAGKRSPRAAQFH